MATQITLHPPFPVDADNFEALRTNSADYSDLTDSEVINKAQLEDRLQAAQVSVTGPIAGGGAQTFSNVSAITFVNALADANNSAGEVILAPNGVGPHGGAAVLVTIYTATPAEPTPTISDFFVDGAHDVDVPAGDTLMFTWNGVNNAQAMSLLWGTTPVYTDSETIPNPTFPSGSYNRPIPSNANASTYYFALKAINTTDGKTATSPAVVVHVEGAPVINSFTATPGTIAPGGSSTLSWSVGGDPLTSLILNPGDINVLGTTQYVVTPSSTTAYTLTATNAGGTTQASATVTVSATASLAITNNTFAGGGNTKTTTDQDSDIIATAVVTNGTLSVVAGDTAVFGATTVTYPNFTVTDNVVRVPAAALATVENNAGIFAPTYNLTVTPTGGTATRLQATGSQFTITAPGAPTLTVTSNTFAGGGNTKATAAPDSDIVATITVTNGTLNVQSTDFIGVVGGSTAFQYNAGEFSVSGNTITIPASLAKLQALENTAGSFQFVYHLSVTPTAGGIQQLNATGSTFTITSSPVLQAGWLAVPLSHNPVPVDSDYINAPASQVYISTTPYNTSIVWPNPTDYVAPNNVYVTMFLSSDTYAANPTAVPQVFEIFSQQWLDWNLTNTLQGNITVNGRQYHYWTWNDSLAFTNANTRFRFNNVA